MHIIDTKALAEMFFGDQDKVTLVTNALIQRIPEWQAEAKICEEENNHEETRQLCHRIRGAASSIKAEKLTATATKLGDIIKTQQFAKLQAGFTDLNASFEELLTLPLGPSK